MNQELTSIQNKQLLSEIQHLKYCVDDLVSRIKILEETNDKVPRFMRCPFCGESDPSPKVTVVSIESWFAGQCSLCKATGPQVTKASEALWAWDRFVSHHGRVSPAYGRG